MKLSRPSLSLFHAPLFAIAWMFLTPAQVSAQCVSLTTPGAGVTQNFNGLANTGTNVVWTDNSTISGAYSTRTTYNAGTGSSNAGSLYSFGVAGTNPVTDRALGGVASGGTGTFYWAVCFTNNTGVALTALDIAYMGEQWRDGLPVPAAAQKLDFEYQTAATGGITDANSPTTGWTALDLLDFTGPVVGALSGALDGNAPANRTSKSANLVVSVPVGNEIWLRWIDVNDASNDHGLAVDDLSVTPNPGGGPAIPSLTVNDVAVTEGNSGTVTAAFTVSLSSPAGVGGVTFDIATADNTATTADNDYVSNSLTGQTIPAGSSTYNFNVTVNGDTAIEANQTFFVNITNVTGATVTDGQGLGTINNDDASITLIHDVQGTGASSPIVGSSVTVRGIVTGIRSNGFFVQEEEADYDADPATSEGILVFTSSAPPPAAAIGNLVQVTGTVVEFVPSQDPLQPPLTELSSPSVVLISSGNPLPSAIPLTTTFPDPAGAHDQLERIEGMRASVSSLTVGGPTGGNVSEPNATSTSTGVFYGTVTGVPRPFREAGIQAPDPAPAGTIPPIPRFDSNPERIRVDSDGLVGGGSALNVGAGTVVTSLVGPLDYSFRTYTLLPESTPAVSGGPLATAVTTPLDTEFTVAAYNLERFFDTVNDPTIGEPVLTTTAFNKRLAKASLGVRDYLKTPDIVGVVEVENLTTLQALASQINADAVAASQPDPAYAAYLVEGNDVGGIDVGFLVKTSVVFGATPRVSVTEVLQELDGTLFVNPDASTETLNDRPPLRLNAVVNHPNGASFPITVIANHLRSLIGASDTSAGSSGWPTAGDRVRAKRQKQAEDLANLVQARQVADPTERILLVGDFNAFEFNDGLGHSMGVIAGTPAPNNETAVTGDGVDLVNPDFTNLASLAPASDRYSFVFDGNAQSLDHALANAPLIADTLARREEHPRINADFPETDRNLAVPSVTRLADHDPIVTFYRVASFGSNNADLSNLTLSAGTLAPVFAAGTTSYAATVGNAVSSMTATPTAADAGATIEVQINGGGFSAVVSGTPSGPLALNVGSNAAEVKVTASDTTTTKTYSIAVHRCAATSLSGLPNGIISAPYSGAATASGGSGTYTYALTGGTLPSGLSLNPSTGALTTTPSATGTFSFQITATDTAPPGTCTGVGNYTVHIGSAITAGDLVIREFRSRGPLGALDEYVEIANRAAGPLTIASTDPGSTGFGIAHETAGLLVTIPNGTVIPAGGSYLAANSTPATGYSLSDYGGTGAASHDASWTTDVPDDKGVALFRSTLTLDIPNRIDAFGFTGSAALYREGAGMTPINGIFEDGQWAYLRKAPHPTGAIKDTGDNAADFRLASPTASLFNTATVQSALGSPGPQNLTSTRSVTLPVALADPAVSANLAPNRLQVGNYHYFRRMLTNNTGAAITKLRFRIADLSTLFGDGYVPGGIDWRGISTTDAAITVPAPVTAKGLTLEAPSVAYSLTGKGGGYNASFSVDLSSLGGSLADGASIYINLGFRNVKGGNFYFVVLPEVLN